MSETEEHEEPAESAAAVPPEQEERIVSKVVEKVKEIVSTLTGGEEQAVGGEGEEGTEPNEVPTEPSSPRQVEADTEAQVRAALDKLRGEEEHQKEHEKLKELERPPAVVSRLTKALWGEP